MNNDERDLEKEAREMKDKAAQSAKETWENAKDKGQEMKYKMEKWRDRTDEYTRQNPWSALAIATGAGMLLGMIMNSGKDKRR